jgi:hypothetical protein
MMPSWCRQVNWGNCGIPWVNCAVLCVKDDWQDSSEACAIAYQNCAFYSVFPSSMTSHSKIVHFNRECTGRFKGVAVEWLKLLLGTLAVNLTQISRSLSPFRPEWWDCNLETGYCYFLILLIILTFDDCNLQIGTRLYAPQVLGICRGKEWNYSHNEPVLSLLRELVDVVQCTV